MARPSSAVVITIATLVALAGSSTRAASQAPAHDPPAARAWHAGAHAVALASRVDPAFNGAAMTEGYLTQPTLFAGVDLLNGHVTLAGTISLEGLTLERGELGPGSYGEGYVDRRHPHTYLHELMATARADIAGVGASLAAGRGFAPFGTDDPMMRPFVRYPANHHLGQVLERLVAIGALRGGPLIVEAGVFSGDEPSDPDDAGTPGRFGDSWAARVTVVPVTGLELQVSHADVTSPELPSGGGWDQRKWSVSARHDRATRLGHVYALVEWKETTQVDDGDDVFAFGSVLGEASLARGRWNGALRIERTDRPEEERLSPFRAPFPHSDLHVLGITAWTIASARIEADLAPGALRISPFGEVARAHVDDRVRGPFDAESFYGSRDIWSISLGARLGIGSAHHRMGRYGAAVPESGINHHTEQP